MLRQIIHIDEEKCNGCAACASACHEGAIGMVKGKARLLRDDYCDGMGDCLPECPTGAITFEEREADAYNEAAVKAHKKESELNKKESELNKKMEANYEERGCPGTRMRQMMREEKEYEEYVRKSVSKLQNWPVQIKLAPVKASYFDGAKLLVAADCTAFAYADFHQDFMKGRITLIGCPKLDMVDYSEKLTEIIKENDIKSVTVLRMEVPCCGGLEMACRKALQNSGKFLPWQVVTISIDGDILE